jgi:hypothetical protein
MSPSIHSLTASRKVKFLLNSRTAFVTEPWNRTHTNTIAGIPYAEVTGLICRIPLPRLHSHILGFSPRGTSAGSWYGCFRFFIVSFSGAPEINQTDHRPARLWFYPVLIITILPGDIHINTSDKMCWSIPKRQKQCLCCHAY